jgi:hypothetical protein
MLRRTKRFASICLVSSMSPLIWIQPAHIGGLFFVVRFVNFSTRQRCWRHLRVLKPIRNGEERDDRIGFQFRFAHREFHAVGCLDDDRRGGFQRNIRDGRHQTPTIRDVVLGTRVEHRLP